MKRSPAALDVRVVERADSVAAVKARAVPECHMLSEGLCIHMAGMNDYKDIVIIRLRSSHNCLVPLVRIEYPYALDRYRGAEAGDAIPQYDYYVAVRVDRAELLL
jgi:hypothetical protein